MELCRPTGHYTKTKGHVAPQIDQVLDRLRESDRVWVDVTIRLIYDE